MFSFNLNDRVRAGDRNDLRVVDHLDTALDELGGVRKPAAPRFQDRVANSLKAYQQGRGVKADGHVGPGLESDDPKSCPEGPTLLALQADLRAKRASAAGRQPRPARHRES